MNFQDVFGSLFETVTPSTNRPHDQTRRVLLSQIATREELSELGKKLAGEHVVRVTPFVGKHLYRRLQENCADIEFTYKTLSESARKKEAITPGAEWLLDNYHVIEKQINDIKIHFPRGYDKTLPRLTEGEYANYPRVYLIALEFIAHTDSVLDVELLNALLEGYQAIQVLTIGEVWAIPIMLRFALLQNLRNLAIGMLRAKDELKAAERLIEDILGDESTPGTQILLSLAEKVMLRPDFLTYGAAHLIRRLRDRGRKASLTLQWLEERLREEGREPEEILKNEQRFQAGDQISIGNIFTSLRGLGYVHWEKWFESTCRIEHILRLDPGNVYHRCDFKTRDLYRHYIERISRSTGKTETDVAVTAISLARDYQAKTKQNQGAVQDPKRTSVGYYLSERGINELEESLQYTTPLHTQLYRKIMRNPTPYYLFSVIILSILPLAYAFYYGANHAATLFQMLAVFLCFAIPASDIGTNLTQWFTTHLTDPYRLPKLDFENGIPDSAKTVVVVHALFADVDSIRKTVEGLHVRALANTDKNLLFGVLADLPDASADVLEKDDEMIRTGHALIGNLNERYGTQQFFILFRKRLWNEKEQTFMGWERKRGKIEEFNRLLLGEEGTSFIITDDLKTFIRDRRYVITLDNDTQLPRGTARQLVAAIAHPLNAPVFDESRNVVVDGYAIIQPRVGVSLTSANASKFAGIFSGHAGLDPYTQTVSDVYQDLFHEGSYIGKGIYDVKAFERALHHRVPENSLLSHDLYEGNFARVGLATDIELYDDFPSKYHVHAKRLHRWIRGDWQLLPWIEAKVPVKDGRKVKNQMSLLGQWKLIDNLRRSLVAPSVFFLIVGACLFLPGNPLFWIALAMLVIAFPVYTNLAEALIIPPKGLSFESHIGGIWKDFYKMSKQALLSLIFTPYQAFISLHAIIVTLIRLMFTKRHLLQWESAYHADRRLGHDLRSFIGEMQPALLAVALSFVCIGTFVPERVSYFLPFMLAWLSSPYIASELSKPRKDGAFELSTQDRDYLYGVAHDTWRYFQNFLNEENNFLIPDNFQEVPQPVLARRTSPTNVSLSMLSVYSAYDCGFISLSKAFSTIKNIFTSLQQLERYAGHFLNWYNTGTLETLYPRYVSMVDSGNMVGHLITISSAVQNADDAPIIGKNHLLHVTRTLSRRANNLSDEGRAKFTLLETAVKDSPFVSYQSLSKFYERLEGILDDISNRPAGSFDNDLMMELRETQSLSHLFNWVKTHPSLQKLSALPVTLNSLRQVSAALSGDPEQQAIVKFLNEMVATQASILSEAEKIIAAMDFAFLYDASKDLFAIGYNVDAARRDSSYYDLLASEARLGSLCAIALGQLPQRHWFALGRGLASVSNGKALLSWTGTMFEYLMPLLIMKDFSGTLLSESYQVVVKEQRTYTRKFRIPWGISESSYSGVDFEKTYQYKAFGVPGLGLKRGLDEDLVVSPYSTMLALQIDPHNSIKNAQAMEKLGFRGAYGFYEAVDFTLNRLAANEKHHIVRSYFAHHQGMSFVAINNVLHDGIWQNRFHADPRIQATDLLLHEKFPDKLPVLLPQERSGAVSEERTEEEETVITVTYESPHTAMPRTHLLSNGRYTVMVDNAGGGYSMYDREIALTRWKEDSVNSNMGTFIFLRDLESKEVWSTAFQPTLTEPKQYEAVFGPDKVEFKRRDNDIFSHLEITVSPEDDVEVRRLSIANLSRQRRVLEVTSFGEVALNSPRADSAHPAFAKMFVQSEFLDEYDALLFSRRPRSKHEEPIYMFHMVTMRTVWDRTHYETSRENFIGRGRSIHRAAAFDSDDHFKGGIGYVLDPCFSLRVRVELEPGETHVVNFITSFSRSREQLTNIAYRYRDNHQISRAFEMAWSQSSIELRNERAYGKHGLVFQRLANALLINTEKSRAKADVIIRNRLGQSGLWRFGISGDVPICLARITEANQTKLAEELLQAHHYLRNRGFQFDLVILNEHPGGYQQTAQEELEFLVRSSFSAGLVDKKGGVFVRNLSQLSDEEKDLLQAVARVSLSGLRGNLAAQLKVDDTPLEWPAYQTKYEGTFKLSARTGQPTHGIFDNGIGSFTENGRCYSLKLNDSTIPPAPWSNVIATPEFGTLISEAGGGFTWSGNSRENRLTPWSNDPVSDPLGEVVYIRDSKSGAFWSPTPRPISLDGDVYVHHRFGESEFVATTDGITSSLKVSVATEDPVKLWNLSLTNLTPHPRNLEIFLYVEWVLGVSRQDTYTQIVSAFDKGSSLLYAYNNYNIDFPNRIAFIGSSHEIEGYTSARTEFMGRNRDAASPTALASVADTRRLTQRTLVRLSQKTGACFDSCGVIKISVQIEGNSTEEISFFMGETLSLEAARTAATKYTAPKAAAQEIQRTKDYFERIVSTVQIETPEKSFDILVNGWLLYQTISCRLFGRSAFYQSGGALGFRDQLQDSAALLISDPDLVKRQILLHASRQFPEGDVQHWWHPPTGKGVRTRISDDYLWLPLIVERYMEVSGDKTILDERAGFIDGPLLPEHEMEAYIVPHISQHTSTIYEKCLLMLDRALRFGSHGLPFIGCGDWNDGMNEIGKLGKGESVWMGWFLALTLRRFLPLVEERGDTARATLYQQAIDQLKKALEENAWDGAWYRRAYFDDGSPVGSAQNQECKIDSLPQSWAIISGLGDAARSKTAMGEVYKHLVDEKNKLIRLFTPPFNKSSQEPGYIKGYLPGIRENGGQYTHAAAWVIIATALLGDGEKAFNLFQLINPILHTNTTQGVAKYRGEPYVLCGDVYSVEPHEGRAGWSWYTGSSGWLYQAGIEYILGLKVRGEYFTVDPCIPPAWDQYKITYKHGATKYVITVKNPSHVSRGVKSIKVSGNDVGPQGVKMLPLDQSQEIAVEVIMG